MLLYIIVIVKENGIIDMVWSVGWNLEVVSLVIFVVH